MKKNILVLLFVNSLFFVSCVSTNSGFQSSPVISRNVELDPIKADIKVDEKNKLSGESSSTYFLFFRVSGDNAFADGINFSTDASSTALQKLSPSKLLQGNRLSKVRGSAAYNALKKGEYDILVHPTYSTTVKNYIFVKEYIVKVQGYGAKYTNFRTERQKIVITEGGKEIILQDN